MNEFEDEDQAVEPAASDPSPANRPSFEHRPPKRGLIGPFSARQVVSLVLVVVIAAVVLVAVTTPLGKINPPAQVDPVATAYLIGSPTVGLRPGSLAPELAGTNSSGQGWQLLDVTGKPVRLADHRGHGVWINFWASWCGPCQSETPTLRTMDQTYRSQGLDLIGISVQEVDYADVAAYAKRYDLGYTIAADLSGDVLRLYGAYALPTQVFIDPNGIVRAVVDGPLTADQAQTYIAAILPSGSTGATASASPGSGAPAGSGSSPLVSPSVP
jgi:cytochrome c biogenesis protein CcmG, thiol:disulfide interchange protein DsbE